VTADKSASIFVTYFIKDSYGVCGGDHDGFGDEASNLPLPIILFESPCFKKNIILSESAIYSPQYFLYYVVINT
jgi:hypothetical protein